MEVTNNRGKHKIKELETKYYNKLIDPKKNKNIKTTDLEKLYNFGVIFLPGFPSK